MSVVPDPSNHSPLVWLDVETTGLDPQIHDVLEIGLVATDADLEPLVSTESPINAEIKLQIVVNPGIVADHSGSGSYRKEKREAFDLNKIDPIVIAMHSKSGLLTEIAEKGVSGLKAQKAVQQWLTSLRRYIYGGLPSGVTGTTDYGDGCKFLMAGSTVGQFDRQFFQRIVGDRTMREFFEYRVVDVSTIKELVRRWYGEDAIERAPKGEKAHRVLSDIDDSISELRHYRDNYFVPTSEEVFVMGRERRI